MRALVYHGPGVKAWEDVPMPEITADTDAVVRVDATTICGTDLHILKGDLPLAHPGGSSATKRSEPSNRITLRLTTAEHGWALLMKW